MRISINGRFLGRRISGVERYAWEISRRISEHASVIKPRKPLRGLKGQLWEQFILPLRTIKYDVLWSPVNIGPVWFDKQVLTLHDISVLEHPEWFHPFFYLYYRIVLPVLVNNVRRIITVSQFSRQHIIQFFNLSAHKIYVVPGGVDVCHFFQRQPDEIHRVLSKYSLPENYILMVSTLEPRKNINTLLQAWKMVHREFPLHELIIAGGEYPVFRQAVFEANVSQTRFLGYIDDDDLPVLYSGARAYINPSQYEGFGLGVLEAMACGTPVLAADAGALPDTLGNCGLLFHPHNHESIAETMSLLLRDTELREHLRQMGFQRVKRFTWERSARATLKILQDAAD